MSIYHVSCGNYISNVAAIFAQFYMANMCTVLCVVWLMPVTLYVAHLYIYRRVPLKPYSS